MPEKEQPIRRRRRRDLGTACMAGLATLALLVLVAWLCTRGTWWGWGGGVVAFVVSLACAYGVGDSLEERWRDDD